MRRRALPLVGLLLAGCGRGGPPPTAAVRGTVTFQGRPLAGGLVVFAPDRDKGTHGRPVTATVGEDGSYAADGVPAGWYRVAVADPPGVDWERDGRWPAYPIALRRPDLAGLDREVVAGRVNELHFHVEVGG